MITSRTSDDQQVSASSKNFTTVADFPDLRKRQSKHLTVTLAAATQATVALPHGSIGVELRSALSDVVYSVGNTSGAVGAAVLASTHSHAVPATVFTVGNTLAANTTVQKRLDNGATTLSLYSATGGNVVLNVF